MAILVTCRRDEVDETLKLYSGASWQLVAVVKADVTVSEVDPDRDGIRTMPVKYELRELYFESK